ncbi:MAG TPA: hypothetical protein VFH29_06270 [Anaerolineales bacterium]|nr:hypothetical protein [Anaerolineales bacterium]
MAPRSFTRFLFVFSTLVVFLAAAAMPQMAQAAPQLSGSQGSAEGTFTASVADGNAKVVPGAHAEGVVALPNREAFIASVVDGNRKVLRGVYAEGVFALPVLQQHYSMEVMETPGTVTQFGMAALYGVTGLLAHNWLSGQGFFLLQVGQQIDLIYGDGRIDSFKVTDIQSYQVTMPGSSYEGYVSLDTGRGTDSEGIFRRVYTGTRHVTFQTCIEKNGDLSWGRLFVIAEKI